MPDYLPLFPLDVVLFPEMSLPLHIFEERYKEMITECLRSNSSFGVLYAHENKVELIGCTARVSKVIRRYSDGRMDLIALGHERFQVRSFDSKRAFLRAEIELLPDLEGEPSESNVQKALEVFARACKLMDLDEPAEFSGESVRQALAFKLVSSLHLDNEIRQRILEAPSEDARLEELTEHLSELIPRLQERVTSSRRAGSNGRLH